MTTHYIQTLGVAKCREILSGAPTQDCFFDTYEEVYYAKDHDHYWEWWDEDTKEWFECEFVVNLKEAGFFHLKDLRAELSLHDTDSCTDIRNHVSPNTVVLEQNLQEQFQEANEAECGR